MSYIYFIYIETGKKNFQRMLKNPVILSEDRVLVNFTAILKKMGFIAIP